MVVLFFKIVPPNFLILLSVASILTVYMEGTMVLSSRFNSALIPFPEVGSISKDVVPGWGSIFQPKTFP